MPSRRPQRDRLVDTIHQAYIDRGMGCIGRHDVGTAVCQEAAERVRELLAAGDEPTYGAARLADAINRFVLEIEDARLIELEAERVVKGKRSRAAASIGFRTDAHEVQRHLLPLLERTPDEG